MEHVEALVRVTNSRSPSLVEWRLRYSMTGVPFRVGEVRNKLNHTAGAFRAFVFCHFKLQPNAT
jgi:hypothetical protein